LQRRVSYCEYRIDLGACASERLFEQKCSGDSVEGSGFPEVLMASVFRQLVSNLWQPSLCLRTRLAKAWWTGRPDVESLEGDHKPMGVSIGCIAAMHVPETDSSAEQRLEVEASVWRAFFFGEALKVRGVTARGPRSRSDSLRLLARGKLRRA